ncbi:MAG TPA: hypothetical protein VHQ47_05820 [Phycisphaerae bacterium]|jgi:hypothetical protein|nr:hypothetical protein [Phycisphaerae bacterium]
MEFGSMDQGAEGDPVGAVVRGTVQSNEKNNSEKVWMAEGSVLDYDHLAAVHVDKVLMGSLEGSLFSLHNESELKVGQPYLFLFDPGQTHLVGWLEIRGNKCGYPGAGEGKASPKEWQIRELLKSIARHGNHLPAGVVPGPFLLPPRGEVR